MLVLDDGWFGHRNDDTTSLGDWVVNREKLPRGLKYLSEEIHKLGLRFGFMVRTGDDLQRQRSVSGASRLVGSCAAAQVIARAKSICLRLFPPGRPRRDLYHAGQHSG